MADNIIGFIIGLKQSRGGITGRKNRGMSVEIRGPGVLWAPIFTT
jgi:hypothetical protein